MKDYGVYIMGNRSGTLYTGVSGDLVGRVWQHKQKAGNSFTARYNVTRLLYYEMTTDVRAAIAREKQIKGYRRAKKVALIESMNPNWDDLSEDWYD